MSLIRIAAVVVDTKQLTLYKIDGETIKIPQGDPRVRSIVDQVIPIVDRGGVAEISLDMPNEFKNFEEQSGGLVRFFRAAKKAVNHIFASKEAEEPIPEGEFGTLPSPAIQEAQAQPTTRIVVNEIIANAQPVSAIDYNQSETKADETMIAVVGEGDDQRIIPGVEALEGLVAHSARNRNTVGMQNLLKRLSKMIDQRAHSVEDLIRFLEKGDLPIADDGSIVAYKRLYRQGDHFVDPHTRKVRQRVGSYVCVAEELVDKNRRNECSNGLHIGRRGYMGSFAGDAITICKVAPEDVIVVPHNDPDKVRVCGYHIVAELPEGAFQAVCQNRPMTEIKGMPQLLGRILKGDHIDRIEEVRITEQKGGGLVITPLKNGKPVKPKLDKGPAPKATALDDAVNDRSTRADPKQVSKIVTQKVGLSRRERARQLMNTVENSTNDARRIQAAQELVAFKKSSKVNWETLGLTGNQAAKVLNIVSQKVEEKPVPPEAPKPAPAPKKAQPIPVPKAAPAPFGGGTRQEKAALLMQTINSTAHPTIRGLAAINLMNLKRTSKVSYAKLGVDISEEELQKIADAGRQASDEVRPGTMSKAEVAAQEKAVSEITPIVEAIPETEEPASMVFSGLSRQEIARALYEGRDWAGLLAHKRKTRLGWQALGFNSKEETEIKLYVGK